MTDNKKERERLLREIEEFQKFHDDGKRMVSINPALIRRLIAFLAR